MNPISLSLESALGTKSDASVKAGADAVLVVFGFPMSSLSLSLLTEEPVSLTGIVIGDGDIQTTGATSVPFSGVFGLTTALPVGVVQYIINWISQDE